MGEDHGTLPDENETLPLEDDKPHGGQYGPTADYGEGWLPIRL